MERTFRAFIVEDEMRSMELMETMIADYCENLEVVGKAFSISEALEEIGQTEFDVLFLDINLPDGTGFNLLNRLESIDFKIIFTTAYEEFAIKAIRYSAIDYLLKPIDIEELNLAIKRLDNEKIKVPEKTIKAFSKTVSEKGVPSHIGLPSRNGIQFIPHKEIVMCEADSSYTTVRTIKKQAITVSKNLKQIQELLSDDDFIRCHRKYLVNKNYIKEYIRGSGGEVIMQDGSFALVSKRMKTEFLKLLRKN